MAYAWMPGVRCIRAETDGGPLKGGVPRAVWLTLGAQPGAVSVQSAAQRLMAEGRSPHLIWDPVTGDIAQLVSILRAGRALGAPENLDWRGERFQEPVSRVNNEGRICAQIGVLARPGEPFTGAQMPGLAAILSWLDSWNVPRRWPAGRPPAASDGWSAGGALSGGGLVGGSGGSGSRSGGGLAGGLAGGGLVGGSGGSGGRSGGGLAGGLAGGWPEGCADAQRSRALWARGGHFGASQVPECPSLGPGGIDTDRLTGAHLVSLAASPAPPHHAVTEAAALAAAVAVG